MTRSEAIRHNAKIILANVRGKTKDEQHEALNSLRFGIMAPIYFTILKMGGISLYKQSHALGHRREFGA